MTGDEPTSGGDVAATKTADQEKVKIFRQFMIDSIGNSHKVIQAGWTVIYTGGTFNFLNSSINTMSCTHLISLRPNANACSLDGMVWPILIPIILLHIFYILTFFRFYVGNTRVFDIRYNEIIKFGLALKETSIPESDELFEEIIENSDKNLFKIECIFLIFQAFVVISLTSCLQSPRDFFRVYAGLMFIDFAWLSIYRILIKSPLQKAFSKLYPTISNLRAMKMVFPVTAANFWIGNNFVTFILLCMILEAHRFCQAADDYVTVLGSMVVGINCLADIVYCWSFYLPKYLTAYNTLVGKK